MLQGLTTKFTIKGTGFKTFKDIVKGYDELGKSFKKTEKEQGKFWTKQAANFKKFSTVVKSGTVKIGNGFRKLKDSKPFSYLEKAGTKAFNVLKRGAQALGAVITASLGVGLKTGMTKESQKLTLETVTGSQARAAELMRYGTQFANVTPFKTSEVSEAVTRLTAAGLDAQKVLGTTGDMSAIMGKGLMQGVEAIIDAQVGELERLKEFGLTKKIIADYGRDIGFGELIDKKGSIKDINKFNTVMFKLMDKKFGGGMKKLSKTTKGLWSTVVGVFADGMSQIVGSAEDGSIKAGSALDTLKSDILQPLAEQFVQWSTDGTFERWGDSLTEAIKKISPYFKDLKGTFNGIKTSMSEFWDTTKPIIYGLSAAIGVLAISMVALNAQFYAIAAGVGLAVAGYIKMKGLVDAEDEKTKKKLSETGNVQKTELAPTIGYGGQAQSNYGTTITTQKKVESKTVNITNSPTININAAGETAENLTEMFRKAMEQKETLDNIAKGII